jgi:hypothetical protein
MITPSTSPAKTRLLVFVAASAVLAAAWTGVVTPVPTELSPLPMLTVIPAFLLSAWNYRFAVLLPTMLFLFWNPALLRGRDIIPKRTYVLLLILTALSALWFVSGWKFGLQYHGAHYIHFVCGVNIGWLALLWALTVRALKGAPSFTKNLVLHCAVFVWLSWYAFPYLGELP